MSYETSYETNDGTTVQSTAEDTGSPPRAVRTATEQELETEPVTECNGCGGTDGCIGCDACGGDCRGDCDTCITCEKCDNRTEYSCICGCSNCQWLWRDDGIRVIRVARPQCADCCGHVVCDRCNQCRNYGNCECYTCDTCGETTGGDDTCGCGCHGDEVSCIECCGHQTCSTYRCDNCTGGESNYCDDHRDDDDDDEAPRGLFQRFPLKFYPAALPTLRKENASKRYISVEIEVAKANNHAATIATRNTWQASIVEDGSLPDSGYEINTQPAAGDVFLQQVRELCAALQSDGAEVTTACGLHVHVDARDLRAFQLRALVELYCAVEPALYATLAPSRQESTFATPCAAVYRNRYLNGSQKSKELRKRAITTVYGTGALDDRAHEYRNAKQSHYGNGSTRYYALNLHSYFLRGTVEFRHHQGTVNATKITNWALLVTALVDAAAKRSATEISRIVSDAATACSGDAVAAGFRLLRAVAGDKLTDAAIERAKAFGRNVGEGKGE